MVQCNSPRPNKVLGPATLLNFISFATEKRLQTVRWPEHVFSGYHFLESGSSEVDDVCKMFLRAAILVTIPSVQSVARQCFHSTVWHKLSLLWTSTEVIKKGPDTILFTMENQIRASQAKPSQAKSSGDVPLYRTLSLCLSLTQIWCQVGFTGATCVCLIASCWWHRYIWTQRNLINHAATLQRCF